MHGLILGAGEGVRLRPLTALLAKPAVPVLGRPLVTYSIDALLGLGVSGLSMTLFHQAQSVLALELPRRYPALGFVIEERLLGTGGGIKHASRQIDDDLLIICNGDTLWDFDLQPVIAAHLRERRDLTLVLTTVPEWRDYSAIRRDRAGRVVRIGRLIEIPFAGALSPPYVFAGITIVRRALLEQMPEQEIFDFITDFVVPLMRSGQPVYGAVLNGFWSDMGTPQRYLEGCLRFAGWRDGAPAVAVVGARCSLHPDALLRDSVLWHDVTVAAPARLQRCIIASGVRIDEALALDEALVLPASLDGERLRGMCYSRVGEALIFPFSAAG